MSNVYSFEPKKRREIISEEKQKESKVAKKFFKSPKFVYSLVSVFFVGILGLASYIFISNLEKPFVLSGAETYNDYYNGSNSGAVVFNEETGDLEYTEDSGSSDNDKDANKDDSFVNNDSLNNYSLKPEDYLFNINYYASSNLGNIDLNQKVYSVSAASSVRETLNRVAEAVNIEGNVYSVASGVEPYIWFGSAHGGDTISPDYARPYIIYSSFSMRNPTPVIPGGLAIWDYSIGTEDCTEVPSINLSTSEYAALNLEQKQCYDIKSLRGLVQPLPTDRVTAESKSEQILSDLGYNVNDFTLIYATDELGLTNLEYELILDGSAAPIAFYFIYANGGSLVSASGFDFKLEDMGDFRMESPENSVMRLNNPSYFGSIASSEQSFYSSMVSAEQVNPFDFQLGGDKVSVINVQYSDDINPLSFSRPPGFNNALASISPELGSAVDYDANIWSVYLGDYISEEQANMLISEIIKSDEILFAFVSSTSNINKDEDSSNGIVEVEADKMIWVLFEDAKGQAFIVKGYIYANNDKNLYYGHVIGLDDALVGLR